MPQMTKNERVLAAAAARPVDRPPVSAWRHFFLDETTADGLAGAMLAFHRRYGWDFMKVNPRATYYAEAWGGRYRYQGDAHSQPALVRAAVRSASDWAHVERLSLRVRPLAQQLHALALIGKELRGEAPFTQTVFSPLSIAANLTGSPEAFLPHLQERPQEVKIALEAITETLTDYCRACLERGASGIFFATTNWATYDRLTDAQYAEFGRPYDLRVLAAAQGAPFNVVHVCRSRNMLAKLADYPAAAFNWDARDPTNPTLAQGKRLTGHGVIGGLSHHITLPNGSPEDVLSEARAARVETGDRGLLLGPGCAVSTRAPAANLRALKAAARS